MVPCPVLEAVSAVKRSAVSSPSWRRVSLCRPSPPALVGRVSGCRTSYASFRRRVNGAWFDGELGCGSGAPDHDAEILDSRTGPSYLAGPRTAVCRGGVMNGIAQGGPLLHLTLGLLIMASVIVAWLIFR
jgi:hypothetical protein